jgi:hypothetical protein
LLLGFEFAVATLLLTKHRLGASKLQALPDVLRVMRALKLLLKSSCTVGKNPVPLRLAVYVVDTGDEIGTLKVPLLVVAAVGE